MNEFIILVAFIEIGSRIGGSRSQGTCLEGCLLPLEFGEITPPYPHSQSLPFRPPYPLPTQLC